MIESEISKDRPYALNDDFMVNPTTYEITDNDLVINYTSTKEVTRALAMIKDWKYAKSFTSNTITFVNSDFEVGSNNISVVDVNYSDGTYGRFTGGITIVKKEVIAPPPVVDNPPTIEDIESIAGFTNDEITINYIANDDNSITKHEFYDGTNWTVKNVVVGESNSFSIVHLFNEPGVKNCKIRVTDAKNQSIESNIFTVTITDRIVSSIEVLNAPYSFKRNQKIVIDYRASTSFTHAYLYGVGSVVDSESIGSSSITFPALSVGEYTSYIGTYLNGVWCTTSKFKLTITEATVEPPPPVDNPPTISDVSNIAGTTGESLIIDYRASDDKGITKHEFYDGSNWITKNANSDVDDRYSITHTFTNAGSKYCKIRITDAKNQSATSNEFIMNITDRVVNNLEILNDPYDFRDNEKVVLKYKSSSDFSSAYLYGVGSVTNSESVNTSNITFPALSVGVYTAYVGVYLNGDQWVTSNKFELTIMEATVEPPPPSDKPPVISQSIQNQNVYQYANFSITYTAADDKEIVKHEFYNSSTWEVKTPTKNGDTYTFSHNFNSLGEKACKIRVTDDNNQSSLSNTFNINVNKIPVVNNPPSVAITRIDTSYTGEYTIKYTLDDNENDNMIVSFKIESEAYKEIARNVKNGSYEYKGSGLSQGVYGIILKVYDGVNTIEKEDIMSIPQKPSIAKSFELYDKTGNTKLGDLTNIIGDCHVQEERNGIFEFVFEYPNEVLLSDKILEENIVKVKANDTQAIQEFRIYDTKKFIDNIITVCARHISFDLVNDHVESVSLTNASCEYALNTLFRSSQFSQDYRGYSDIINAQNYNIENSNIIRAIAGKKGSIIDTYGTGAEILRDNKNIHVLSKRGHDNSVTIEYGKNLTGFELEVDLTDLETRCGGFATYTEEETNKQIIVKSDWIDSPFINNFAHPYISVEGRRDYSDKFDDKEIPTKAKLNKLCQDEFKINKRDIPSNNYKINFIPLSKCVGYEGIQDKISLCDIVTIMDKRFNVNTKAKVISYKYDPIKERYISMELGEPRTTLGDIVGGGDIDKPQDGKPGIDGKPGADGKPGLPGADGITYYTWIRYADNMHGGGMSNLPTGKTYIGLAYNKLTATESNNPSDYTWSKYVGDQGIPGQQGSDGITYYTWIKYADNAQGGGMSDIGTNKEYIGIAYNKPVKQESTNPKDYSWTRLKGDQGLPGQPGVDGTTYYTWIKYADSPTSGMSDNPAGKVYLGLAHNKTTQQESTNYEDYTWCKIKGEDGNIGDFPNSLPNTPTLKAKVLGFASIDLSWTYEDKVYYIYELYASKTKDFTPNVFDLIHKGQSSSFLYQAKPMETWYFKVCAVNTHGNRTAFSPQIEVTTKKLDAFGEYFSNLAVGNLVTHIFTTEYMEAGIVKGNWIDAKHLSVTDGNGKRTLDIDSFGNITLLPSNFKVLVNGTEEGVVTNTRFEQTKDDFTFKVQNTGKPNEIFNSDFSQISRGWTIESYNADCFVEYSTGYSGVEEVGCYSLYLGLWDGNGYCNAYQRFKPINPRMTTFTVGGCYHYDDVRVETENPYPLAYIYIVITCKDGSVEYYNQDEVMRNNNYISWVTHQRTFNRGTSKEIDYIDFYVYKRSTTGKFRITNLDFHEGNEHRKYRPATGQVYSNTTKVDGEGIEIIHDNGAKSRLSHEKIEFTSGNGRKTLRIKDGGINMYDPSQSHNELVGFVKPSGMASLGENINGVTVSTYNQGDYVSIGHSFANTEEEWTSTSHIVVAGRAFNNYNVGVNIFQQSWFRGWMNLKRGNPINFSYDGQPPSQIYSDLRDLYLNIYGNDGIRLGVLIGQDRYMASKIYEDLTSSAKVATQHWGHHDFNGWTLYNANINRTLEPISFELKTKLKNNSQITNLSVPFTFNDDEIRYTNTNTNTTSNFEIIIELPQILSENIVDNYHVNISKLSFGDYRIKERNRYYFILESDRECFSFTFEVVAKQIEKASNNAKIASMQYLETSNCSDNKIEESSYIDITEQKEGI